MMALLGSLLGFGSSFLPEVLSYFKANQVQKHRMEMMQLETQLAQKRSEMKLVELDKQADIAETKGLYEHDRSIDAGGFINALRGSVRPVITYAFFGLFVATKVVIMVKVGQSGGDWTEAVELMWDPIVDPHRSLAVHRRTDRQHPTSMFTARRRRRQRIKVRCTGSSAWKCLHINPRPRRHRGALDGLSNIFVRRVEARPD